MSFCKWELPGVSLLWLRRLAARTWWRSKIWKIPVMHPICFCKSELSSAKECNNFAAIYQSKIRSNPIQSNPIQAIISSSSTELRASLKNKMPLSIYLSSLWTIQYNTYTHKLSLALISKPNQTKPNPNHLLLAILVKQNTKNRFAKSEGNFQRRCWWWWINQLTPFGGFSMNSSKNKYTHLDTSN